MPDDLAPGETLVDRRRSELQASADVLGIARIVWLGYADSGMTGWEQNADPHSFHLADVDEAAGRLADVLREESADILTIYDWHGGYGHPDHVKVHRVGVRAGEMVPGVRVLESTMNRTRFVAMMAQAIARSAPSPTSPRNDATSTRRALPTTAIRSARPESEITLEVDVTRLSRTEAGGAGDAIAAR